MIGNPRDAVAEARARLAAGVLRLDPVVEILGGASAGDRVDVLVGMAAPEGAGDGMPESVEVDVTCVSAGIEFDRTDGKAVWRRDGPVSPAWFTGTARGPDTGPDGTVTVAFSRDGKLAGHVRVPFPAPDDGGQSPS